jgi:hypothetical protein
MPAAMIALFQDDASKMIRKIFRSITLQEYEGGMPCDAQTKTSYVASLFFVVLAAVPSVLRG